MNDSIRVKRQITARSQRLFPRCSRHRGTRSATSRVASTRPAATAMIIASTVIAACGSASPSSSSSSGSSGSNSSQTQLQQEALNFSRCMRSHGVSSFPDPTATGGVNLNVPGINPSSPAFKAAQTACRLLMPVKRPLSGPPSAQAYTRLLHWATCMRARDRQPPRSEARPASASKLRAPIRHADGGRRVLGRDPELDQRALARVHALGDRVRRITRWTSRVGLVAHFEQHPRGNPPKAVWPASSRDN